MALSIQQSEEYLGKDRWQWAVWLEGTPDELNAVEHVVYILHSTFPKPVRVVDDRATNFRLEASGWGAFTIHAKVMQRNGGEIALEHELLLRYPDGTPTSA